MRSRTGVVADKKITRVSSPSIAGSKVRSTTSTRSDTNNMPVSGRLKIPLVPTAPRSRSGDLGTTRTKTVPPSATSGTSSSPVIATFWATVPEELFSVAKEGMGIYGESVLDQLAATMSLDDHGWEGGDEYTLLRIFRHSCRCIITQALKVRDPSTEITCQAILGAMYYYGRKTGNPATSEDIYDWCSSHPLVVQLRDAVYIRRKKTKLPLLEEIEQLDDPQAIIDKINITEEAVKGDEKDTSEPLYIRSERGMTNKELLETAFKRNKLDSPKYEKDGNIILVEAFLSDGQSLYGVSVGTEEEAARDLLMTMADHRRIIPLNCGGPCIQRTFQPSPSLPLPKKRVTVPASSIRFSPTLTDTAPKNSNPTTPRTPRRTIDLSTVPQVSDRPSTPRRDRNLSSGQNNQGSLSAQAPPISIPDVPSAPPPRIRSPPPVRANTASTRNRSR